MATSSQPEIRPQGSRTWCSRISCRPARFVLTQSSATWTAARIRASTPIRRPSTNTALDLIGRALVPQAPLEHAVRRGADQRGLAGHRAAGAAATAGATSCRRRPARSSTGEIALCSRAKARRIVVMLRRLQRPDVARLAHEQALHGLVEPGRAQRLAEHRPASGRSGGSASAPGSSPRASRPCSRNTARRAAVSVIAWPAAWIWPMNTRCAGSLWNAATAASRSRCGVLPSIRSGRWAARPARSCSSGSVCQPHAIDLRLALVEHVLDPGDRGRDLGQGEQAAQPRQLPLDPAQIAVLDRRAQLRPPRGSSRACRSPWRRASRPAGAG